MRRALLHVLPALAAAAFALASFWPARGSLTGWGGDPVFNLWTFEWVWHQLGAVGPLHLFSDAFWSAPLFNGAADGLAYSENQLYPALLSWPLRLASGSGPWTLGALDVAATWAAFACAAGWLRSLRLGERRWSGFGGLIFAACGWAQSQYAHQQNVYIFLLPLALWSWERLLARPGAGRVLACALAFGWIGGWNLYFQFFADCALLGLALAAARQRRQRPALLALTVGLALLAQWPIARHYVALGHQLGSYRAIESFGAGWRSVLGECARPTLLKRLWPRYPAFEVQLEEAGFLGVTWLALMLLSLRRRESRPWLLASALFYWLALGHGRGLFDLAAALPAVAGLRAIGRAQLMTMLLSLPAVLGLLESWPIGRAALALGLVLAELIPGANTQRVSVPPPLEAPLLRELASARDPVLVLPEADAATMLQLLPADVPFLGGSSGRTPPGHELLHALAQRLTERAPGALDPILALTRATRVLALSVEAKGALLGSPRARDVRCFERTPGGEACLFHLAPATAEPPLRLERDAAFSVRTDGPWPVAELRATAPGALELARVDHCRLRQTLRFPFLLPLRHELPLQGNALLGVRFEPGALILRREVRQAIFRLPGPLRPAVSFEVICE